MTSVVSCPNCKTPSVEVRLLSHYDTPVDINQCQTCGGLWFDSLELLKVKIGASDTLSFTKEKLSTFKTIQASPLYCPRDNTELTVFRDPNFPAELIVDYCRKCGGFWFNYGEFSQYQQYRTAKMTDARKIDMEKQITELLARQREAVHDDTLQRFGKLLMTPMYQNPTDPEAQRNLKQAEQIAQTAIHILQILLRLFLKI